MDLIKNVEKAKPQELAKLIDYQKVVSHLNV